MMKQSTNTTGIPSIALANGMNFAPIGYGSYKVAAKEEGISIIESAVKVGYRLIDTAAMYGNEQIVGQGLRRAIDKGLVSREELIVTTKLANTDRGYDNTLKAFEKSEKELGLGRPDLFLVHWPASAGTEDDWEHINADTWRAMETLYNDGRVGAIGVSNFMPEHLEALSLTAQILPMVNQIEFHPGYMQKPALEWCKRNKVTVEGWSPLGRTRILGNPLLKALAAKYERTVAQICLRWAIQHGVVPLPKTTHAERMAQNLNVFDFSISDDDMKLIDSMPQTGESGLTPDTITF